MAKPDQPPEQKTDPEFGPEPGQELGQERVQGQSQDPAQLLRGRLDQLLATAYHRDQVEMQADAAEALRAAFAADPDLAALARVESQRLAMVDKARSRGGRSGCHVTAVLVRVLRDALA